MRLSRLRRFVRVLALVLFTGLASPLLGVIASAPVGHEHPAGHVHADAGIPDEHFYATEAGAT